jgi:hypothetical protein
MSMPQDLREMAQIFRDMTQTIRVHMSTPSTFAMKATRLVRQSTN